MKIFTTEQIRAWDAYSIAQEPVASVELMNRAALAFTAWFTGLYPDTEQPVFIFAGTGNNGGDGIAVARFLCQRFYPVKVFVCDFSGKHSADFDAQIKLLPPHEAVDLHVLKNTVELPDIPATAILIDALFGSGLARPVAGDWGRVIALLNHLPNEKVAIDLPSGTPAEPVSNEGDWPSLHVTRTFSFETPKLVFFFPEYADRVGEWAYGTIGLHQEYAEQTDTPYHYLTRQAAQALIRRRTRFSHKGTYGHALLFTGSFGKMGAAVLAARACLRAGAGLLTAHTPVCGYAILQTSIPEAMCSVDRDEYQWSELPYLDGYNAIGAGCGIGTGYNTWIVLEQLLTRAKANLVLDADALNLLARHPDWLTRLPENTILTPHPKEFERLFGASTNSFERNALQRAKARELGMYIILKGANTAIACPDGSCWFNSTGNPGMATGGSGDVLTGILTGLLAQQYSPKDACLLGVYLHGLAGDLAAGVRSQPGMIAGDLTEYLGAAWLALGGPNW